MISVLHIFIFK